MALYGSVVYAETTYAEAGGGTTPPAPVGDAFCVIARVSAACGEQCAGRIEMGALARARAYYYLNDSLADPTSVVARVQSPAGVDVSYTYGTDESVVREALGTYRLDVAIVETGTWHTRWETGGAGAAEYAFTVPASAFTFA